MMIRILGSIAILGVLVLLLHHSFPLPDLLAAISVFPLSLLGVCVGIALMISFIKGIRFFLLLRAHHIPIQFNDSIRLFFASQATSAFPAGEALRGWLVYKESGKDAAHAVSPVIFQVLFEVSGAVALASVGCFFLPEFIPLAFVGIGSLTLVMTAIHWSDHLNRHVKKIRWFHKQINGVSRSLTLLRTEIQHHSWAWFLQHTALSTLSHLLLGLVLFTVASGLDLDISIPRAVFIAAMSVVLQTVGGFLPGGIGVTEGGMAGIFLSLGYGEQEVIPVIILFRFVTLGFFILLGLCVFTMFYAKTFFTGASRSTSARSERTSG